MPRRPLLAIVVSHDAAANELHMEVMGSPELRINPQLDAEVSLRAQQALASVSPSFDAELTATTHFVENLERITRDEATARISEVRRPPHVPQTIDEVLLKEFCLHCDDQIAAAYQIGSVEVIGWVHRHSAADHQATPRPR